MLSLLKGKQPLCVQTDSRVELLDERESTLVFGVRTLLKYMLSLFSRSVMSNSLRPHGLSVTRQTPLSM